jgi:hypothetical protein
MGTGFMKKTKSLQHQELNIPSRVFHDFKQWHIAKHDVYGNGFSEAWKNSIDVEISPENLELIPQEDEVEYE